LLSKAKFDILLLEEFYHIKPDISIYDVVHVIKILYPPSLVVQR
jgi:hypothetical protein